MLALEFILENAEAVEANCRNRGVPADVAKVVRLAGQRSRLIQAIDARRHERNQVSASIPREEDAARKQALIARGRELRGEIEATETELQRTEAELHAELLRIPNLTHPDAPVGFGDQSNRELRRCGEPLRFDFPPLDHVALAEKHDLIDLEGGARVAGHGFYFLKNEAVLLEWALVRYALGVLQHEGFTLTATPDLARDEVLQGIGFIPRGPETQIYSIEQMGLSLVATAEITLGGLFRDAVLDESQLPIFLAGVSHCFRTEAGGHGRATRGIYRVHQFTKVEMFAFTLPEQSDATLDRLVGIEERIFQGLGIPYRVIDTCSGELGGPAYRKFDLEAWMPGRDGEASGDAGVTPVSGELRAGAWGEVTSASNCTDYQARRLGIRFKRAGKKGTQFVHTLNGTAVAVPRALVAIFENYQQADGGIVIPEALRPWVGTARIATG